MPFKNADKSLCQAKYFKYQVEEVDYLIPGVFIWGLCEDRGLIQEQVLVICNIEKYVNYLDDIII